MTSDNATPVINIKNQMKIVDSDDFADIETYPIQKLCMTSSALKLVFQEGQLSVTGESMCTKYWLTA